MAKSRRAQNIRQLLEQRKRQLTAEMQGMMRDVRHEGRTAAGAGFRVPAPNSFTSSRAALRRAQAAPRWSNLSQQYLGQGLGLQPCYIVPAIEGKGRPLRLLT